MRMSYIIMETHCYYGEMSEARRDRCFDYSAVLNDTSTVLICVSITLFFIVDLLKIRK